MTKSIKITCTLCPWTSYEEGEDIDVMEAIAASDRHIAKAHPETPKS